MRSNGQEVIRCKNCGSNKVEISNTGCGLFGSGIVLILMGIWIPIIGWFYIIPAGVIMMLIGILFPIIIKNKSVTCKSCNHKFSVNKKVYQAYKKEIK